MKKWFVGFIFFFVLYVFFVIARTPAQWVIQQTNLPENIVLQGVTGTVWNANIDQILANGYIINQVKAQVSILSLFSFNPSVDVTFGGALVNGPEGEGTLSNVLENITVTNARVTVLANDIAQQLTLPIPLTAQKYLDLTINEFVMGSPICNQLSGDVQWDNASINALDQKVKFGSLKAILSCDKGEALIKFDPSNDLGLTLSVTAHSPERVSGYGYIKPGSKFPKALKEILPFLGSPDNKGRYKLKF